MNSLYGYGLYLLAEAGRIENMGRKFRGGEKLKAIDLLIWLLVLSGMVLGFWLLSLLKDRQDSVRRVNSPRKLYHELCKLHGLNYFQRRLLRQIARWQRLTQPTKLFLEPERLEAHNLSPRLRARWGEIASIGRKLFSQQSP